jgi:hypothetical protein
MFLLMTDIAAYLRLSHYERQRLRPSITSAMEAWLDEQPEEWRVTQDVSKMIPKRLCDFCRKPKRLHPSDGWELCSDCEPVLELPPSIPCILCREKKKIRYRVADHPVCADCGWPDHKSHNCNCLSCCTPNLPVSWYKGLLDYYASRLEDAKAEIRKLKN